MIDYRNSILMAYIICWPGGGAARTDWPEAGIAITGCPVEEEAKTGWPETGTTGWFKGTWPGNLPGSNC